MGVKRGMSDLRIFRLVLRSTNKSKLLIYETVSVGFNRISGAFITAQRERSGALGLLPSFLRLSPRILESPLLASWLPV